MTILQDAANSIRQSSIRIEFLTQDLPDELTQWKPAADVWSILEIMCHVEEILPYWKGELLSVLENPGKQWGRGINDERRIAAVEAAGTRTPVEVMSSIFSEVEQIEKLFVTMNDDVLQIESPSRNPNFPANMNFLVHHLLVEHIEKHAAQIERNIKQHKEIVG